MAISKPASSQSSEVEVKDGDVVILDEASPEAPANSGKFIRYVGEATRRIISKEDWASIGIESEGGDQWTIANDLKVETASLSQDKINYLLKTDGRFQASNS